MASKTNGFIPGVIVFVALVIFFGTILGLTGKNILISRNYRIYFEFPDISGLRNQGAVALRGFQVGKVKDVTFSKDSVVVAVDINRKFRVPLDSKIEIITLNFIGEKAVSITPGTSAEVLKPGGVLKGANKDIVAQAANILAAMKMRIEGGDLDKVVQKATDSIDKMLKVVKTMHDKVQKIDIDLYNRRVDDIGLASRQLKDFLVATQEEVQKIEHETIKSTGKFNETLEKVDQALKQLEDLSAEINGTAQKINRTDLFGNLNKTIAEMQAFLADIKKNPKKYVRFSIF